MKIRSRSRSKVGKELDMWFSLFIRLFFCDKNWYCSCYTCWTKMKWNDKDCSCWHWITRAVHFLRRCVNNARPQCMWRCNSKMSGNWEPQLFRMHLVKEIWAEKVEEMEKQLAEYKKDPSKFKVRTSDMEWMILDLQEKVRKLAKEKNQIKALPERIRKKLSKRFEITQ